MTTLQKFYSATLLMPALLFAVTPVRETNGDERIEFAGSIREIANGNSAGDAHVTRSVLRSDELEASMHIAVAMEIRNAIEFHTRIDSGEKISETEMESRYLPLQTDYDKVTSWLKSEGFVMDETTDPKRLNVFAHHSVSEVSRVFDVKFARVMTSDGEFTSAVTAPSVPVSYAPSILGVLGLQPHLRFHKHYTLAKPDGQLLSPSDLRVAYNVPSTLTGAGQAIAIIMQGPGPLPSDLTTFWSDSKVPQSTSNYTSILINSGAVSPSGSEFESSVDVEWSSGMAPGAAIRFYNLPYLDDIDAAAALTQVAADRQTVSNLNVVTMSFGASEWGTTGADNLNFHNIFAVLVNDGVTLFASSGDGGSNPDASGSTNDYGTGSNFPLNAEYPASDPDVTGVGGTDLKLNANGTIATETAWFLDASNGSANNASGGGLSAIYGRPSWQVGSSLPSNSFRLVPDVAACASNVKGSGQNMFVVYENSRTGNLPFSQQLTGGVGTSFSSPIWAGICACMNQARSNAGQGPLGLLGPRIYPLLGTSAFQDITTSGTLGNGAYSAGVGYDYLTGLGSPNVTNLVTNLITVNNPAFNGDGNADIIWQNTETGDRGIFLMQGTAVAGWVDLGAISTEWRIAGSGDFASDGNTDILWQNTVTGDCGIYMMSQKTIVGWVDIGTVPLEWQIAGVADFNGDGKPDILWRNTITGDCGVYLMNGTNITGWADIGYVPLEWRVGGIGNFGGTGQPDILWQDTVTGDAGIYLMNGTAVTGWHDLGVLPLQWQVAAVGSYNGDGNADILWQNTVTGDSGFYIMNGTNVTGWVDLGVEPTQWKIAP